MFVVGGAERQGALHRAAVARARPWTSRGDKSGQPGRWCWAEACRPLAGVWAGQSSLGVGKASSHAADLIFSPTSKGRSNVRL